MAGASRPPLSLYARRLRRVAYGRGDYQLPPPPPPPLAPPPKPPNEPPPNPPPPPPPPPNPPNPPNPPPTGPMYQPPRLRQRPPPPPRLAFETMIMITMKITNARMKGHSGVRPRQIGRAHV